MLSKSALVPSATLSCPEELYFPAPIPINVFSKPLVDKTVCPPIIILSAFTGPSTSNLNNGLFPTPTLSVFVTSVVLPALLVHGLLPPPPANCNHEPPL